MAEYLFIKLQAEGDLCSTVVLDEDGGLVRPTITCTLAEAAAQAGERRVVVLVPASDVVLTQVALPALNQGRLRQMLPYSLEDAFAEDVDELLFAAGARLESGEVRVAVVARAVMDSWLGALAAAGVTPSAMYAETEGVPDTPSTLNLIIDETRTYGRRPGQPAFVLEGLGPMQVYELLEGQSEECADLRYVDLYVAEEERERFDAELAQLQERVSELNLRLLADGVVARFAANLLAQRGTNLLQGPYAPKSNVRALVRPWATAAGLLVALLGLHLIVQSAEYIGLRHDDAALGNVLDAACRRQLSASSLDSCESMVRQTLSQAGLARSADAGETFLTTLAALAEKRDPRSRIEALNYRNDVMDLQVVAPDIPSLDSFAQQMTETKRFDVRIQSATPGDSGVEGRLQITGAAQ